MAALLLGVALPSWAQPTAPASPTRTRGESTYERAMRLQSRAFAAMNAGAYAEAAAALRQQAELQPDNFVVHYNLACAHARGGDSAASIASLKRSIELGFIDLAQMQTDADLASIRGEPEYLELVEKWDAVVRARAEANLGHLRAVYGEAYLYELDDERRLMFATAYDETSFAAARDELRLLWSFGIEEVFPELRETRADDPWVSVVLPSREDYTKWVFATYGGAARNSFSGIGGAYDHDRKQLVAQDLGGTLRHEFFHVLHWRSNSRHRQAHPIWVQEGLCALVEDYDVVNGRVVPAPSWRTNTAKRLLSGGKLTPIEELAAMGRDAFIGGGRTMARYAEARTFFLFLHQRGTLGKWYARFCETFAEDPTGIAALVEVLGTDIDGVNQQYREWLRDLPTVPEPGGREGRSGLGVDIDPGSGDGPVITQVVSREARRGGLRAGDVVYAIDGRPTRDVFELVRVLGMYEPGATVTLSVRRKTRHLQTEVRLTTVSGT